MLGALYIFIYIACIRRIAGMTSPSKMYCQSFRLSPSRIPGNLSGRVSVELTIVPRAIRSVQEILTQPVVVFNVCLYVLCRVAQGRRHFGAVLSSLWVS